MADPRAAARWRRDAALARSERSVLAAVRAALAALADYTRHTLAQSGLDHYVLDDRAPAWRDALSGRVTPAIYEAFTAAWELLDRGTGIDPTLHGTRYLEGVWNRLVGASDEVFDRVRGAIEAGRQEGLHPSVVAKDVDALLSDTTNWEGRARTIARTECLPPWAVVEGAAVTAAYRRAYSGPWVTIRTENGHEFSGTPNHPVMTLRGWRGLGEVTEGDNLVCHPLHVEEPGASRDVDVEAGPASIAEVFDAAAAVGVTLWERAGKPDFHGDGIDGEVEVARPYRVLRHGSLAPITEGLCEQVLTPSDVATVVAAAECSPFHRGFVVDQQACLCGSTDSDAALAQDSADDPSSHTVLAGKHLRGRPLLVGRDDGLLREVQAGAGSAVAGRVQIEPSSTVSADFAAGFADYPCDNGCVAPDLSGHRTSGLAGQVEVQKVASVSLGQYAGHVYNLSTVHGYFATNAGYTGNTLGANNAGARASAEETAKYLGYTPDDVQRVWLATGDDRTRESHLEADGQTIYGLDATYQVGDGDLAFPGDPDGPPEEVISCRCTEQFWYPGDPEYITASGALTAALDRAEVEGEDDPTGVIVCALPAETDPVQRIGPEPKHATLLFYGALGDLPEQTDVDTLRSIVAGYAGITAPFTETVTGVEPLGEDGARVWMLDTEGTLAYIAGDLPDYDSEAQPEVEQFDTLAPHVTIGYPEDGDDRLDEADEAAAANVSRITFDRLAVWAGPDQWEYALTGDPDSTDNQESTVARSSTASAARETRGQIVDRLVASGFFPTRAHAAQHAANVDRIRAASVRAAAGDQAPVPVESDDGAMAVGDDAPIPTPEVDDPYGPNPDRFHGIGLVEDEETGDRRVFAPGSVYWDDAGLPMPFGWQVQDAPGHDNAIICGRIDTFERVGNAITYTGTWDLDGAGWETRRLVEGQFLRGISVDTDDFDVVIVNPDGTPVDPFDMMLGDTETEPVMLVEKSRLRSATACRVPAFAPSGTTGAYIANGLPEDLQAAVDAGMEGEAAPEEAVAVAALVAAGASYTRATQITERPPAAWYGAPDLDHPTPITISDTGRVFGHLAAWGTCHIGIQGTCVTPPHSITDYAHFAHGITDTDGGPIITGLLTMDTGHAAPDMRALPAAAHYDDTGTQFATVAVGEDDLGIWIAGSVLPEATAAQIAKVNRAGALSGDWRRIRGNLELVAALAVNVPGYPIPRLSMAASAAEGQLSLVAAGIVTRDVEAAETASRSAYDDVRAMVASALADERATDARLQRVEAAARRLRAQRAGAAARRIG